MFEKAAKSIRRAFRQWRPRHGFLYLLARYADPLFDLHAGGARRPVFHDIDRDAPGLRAVDAAFDVVREELDAVIAAYDRLPPYHGIDTDVIYSSGRTDRDRRWSIFFLTSYGLAPEAARVLAPRTLALVSGIPGVQQAMFSILEPGKSIAAHAGPSRVYLRYHLGLYVPTDDPPAIRVKDMLYTWKERESVLFDDSWDHEVVNRSRQMRAVLIVDVARPMPFPLTVARRAIAAVAARAYAPRVIGRMNALIPPPRGD